MLQVGLPTAVYEASEMPWQRPGAAAPPIVARRGLFMASLLSGVFEEEYGTPLSVDQVRECFCPVCLAILSLGLRSFICCVQAFGSGLHLGETAVSTLLPCTSLPTLGTGRMVDSAVVTGFAAVCNQYAGTMGPACLPGDVSQTHRRRQEVNVQDFLPERLLCEGDRLTLAAPGVQALGLGLGGLLVKDSGTSMAGRWHPGGCYHGSYTSDTHFIAFAAPQVASAAAVLIAYAKSKGVQVDANPALPAALKKALGGSAKPFESSADAAKVPAGVLDVQAAVVALDVQGLLNAQRQAAAAATASVGVTIVLAVVFFLAGVLVTALAVFARMRFRNPPSPAVASEVDAP